MCVWDKPTYCSEDNEKTTMQIYRHKIENIANERLFIDVTSFLSFHHMEQEIVKYQN